MNSGSRNFTTPAKKLPLKVGEHVQTSLHAPVPFGKRIGCLILSTIRAINTVHSTPSTTACRGFPTFSKRSTQTPLRTIRHAAGSTAIFSHARLQCMPVWRLCISVVVNKNLGDNLERIVCHCTPCSVTESILSALSLPLPNFSRVLENNVLFPRSYQFVVAYTNINLKHDHTPNVIYTAARFLRISREAHIFTVASH